jgi:predicted peroxiredoxin
MKTASILCLIAIVIFCSPLRALSEEDRELFVVLTTPDVQTQTMALVLTTEVFRQHKAIRILLCGPAGDLALREGEERIVQPINKSPQMLLRSLIERGVTVQICPLYLPNRGASADELIEGVTRAKPPLVAEQLLREGVRLFTF